MRSSCDPLLCTWSASSWPLSHLLWVQTLRALAVCAGVGIAGYGDITFRAMRGALQRAAFFEGGPCFRQGLMPPARRNNLCCHRGLWVLLALDGV